MHPARVHGNQLGRICHPSLMGSRQPPLREVAYATVTEQAASENFEHAFPLTA